MRDMLSQALVDAAKRDPRVLVLTGDHGYSLFDAFRAECGSQYINAGVAEQGMVGIAAGLAKAGFRPIVYGLSAFIPVRVYEQVKLDVCYESLPVCFLGDGAGVVYSTLGTSHQCTEDIAALRALPEMTLLSPADAAEMERCMQLATRFEGPTHIRIGKADLGVVEGEPATFGIGDLRPVRPSDGSIAWVATGSMVHVALRAASRWPGSGVWSVPCIKPLDRVQVAEICRSHQLVVTLEEHTIYGGLGAAIAEIASEEAPNWVLRIGVEDKFSLRCGSYAYLQRDHGLDVESVCRKVSAFCARRGLSATAAAAKAA
jgi:transketolase